MRLFLSTTLAAAALGLAALRAPAQPTAADGPLLRAAALRPTAAVKLFVSSGTVRLVGWDRDSLVVRGTVGRGSHLIFGAADSSGAKLVVEEQAGTPAGRSTLVIYLPRRSQVAAKGVDLQLSATDLSGWYYTVSGRMHFSGSVSSIDAEAIGGSIDLDVSTPWARVKTGEGRLLIRGAPQDVDASTIGGTLDIAASSILRGRFASVTGDIRYAAVPAPGSLFEFSDHAGTVDLLLPRDASARLELSSVTGDVANGFTETRPIATGPHSLRLRLGRGDAQVTVRTFRGTIRLRPR
jgi:hypothetical protein